MNVSIKPARVLVIDDDPLVRTGIRLLLRGNTSVSIVGEFASHRGLLEAVKDLQPDVLLMDLFMPEESGLSVARRVRLMYPHLRMVLMSSIDNPALSADARNVGVNAFVAKTAPAADFITALVGADSSSKISTTVLSDREIQVVELLAMGAATKRSQRRSISVRTRSRRTFLAQWTKPTPRTECSCRIGSTVSRNPSAR